MTVPPEKFRFTISRHIRNGSTGTRRPPMEPKTPRRKASHLFTFKLGTGTPPPPQAKPPKPVRTEPRWRAVEPALIEAINQLKALLESQETRRRRRRARDAATFHRAIENIAVNLVAVSLVAPERPLAITTANEGSQIAPHFGKPARKAIDLMLTLGLVTKVRGYPFRGSTTIAPTIKLRHHLPLGALDWNALRLDDAPRLIVLNDGRATAPARWLKRVTDEVRAINECIRNARIEYDGNAAFIVDRPSMPMVTIETPHHRALRRIFSGNYERGGRLYGGFWETLPRAERHHLRIDGEPVVMVDFNAMYLHICYAQCGTEPPPGDLYDLTGYYEPQHRAARKTLINAMLSSKTPLRQWPGDFEEREAIRQAFPTLKPRDAVKLVKEKHAAIAHLFERGHGSRLMRQESDIITAATLACFRAGITALPIHDGILVARSRALETGQIMQREAERLLPGTVIPVSIEAQRV